MVPINLNITSTLLSIIKQIPKLILLGSKLNRANYTPTLSSVQIVKVIIRWTLTCIPSRNIGSIVNGMQRSIKSFVKTEDNQFIYL